MTKGGDKMSALNGYTVLAVELKGTLVTIKGRHFDYIFCLVLFSYLYRIECQTRYDQRKGYECIKNNTLGTNKQKHKNK